MKLAANIVGALVGLLFVATGVVYFLKLAPVPEMPEGSPIALFNQVMLNTGYMNFVKAVEILGGLLVAFPKTRNLGLLCLGPVLLNIFAVHLFVIGDGLLNPVLLFVTFGLLFLLWTRRAGFLALITRET